jgi:flagellar motor switch protein FliG
MRVPIVDIGNSKGIRIPQAILRQVRFGDEIEMDVAEGSISLRRTVDPSFVPDFDSIAGLDDTSIQRLLRKIEGRDLLTALVGADRAIKAAVYRNLSERVRAYLEPTVARLESGDARDLIIERSRNLLCEALMVIAKD